MATYADHDAEQVARGIRLGGRGKTLDQALNERPLTVADLERLTRPDLYEDGEDVRGPEGMLRVYQASETFTIAADWWGWLPGHYITRDAALIAYGYVLGGERAGRLDRLALPCPAGYTVAEIEAFAAGAPG